MEKELCGICSKNIETNGGGFAEMDCERHFVHTQCIQSVDDFKHCVHCGGEKEIIQQQQLGNDEEGLPIATTTNNGIKSIIGNLFSSFTTTTSSSPVTTTPTIDPNQTFVYLPVNGHPISRINRTMAHFKSTKHLDESRDPFLLLKEHTPIPVLLNEKQMHLPELVCMDGITIDDFLDNGYVWDELKTFPQLSNPAIVKTAGGGGGGGNPNSSTLSSKEKGNVCASVGLINLCNMGLNAKHLPVIGSDGLMRDIGLNMDKHLLPLLDFHYKQGEWSPSNLVAAGIKMHHLIGSPGNDMKYQHQWDTLVEQAAREQITPQALGYTHSLYHNNMIASTTTTSNNQTPPTQQQPFQPPIATTTTPTSGGGKLIPGKLRIPMNNTRTGGGLSLLGTKQGGGVRLKKR